MATALEPASAMNKARLEALQMATVVNMPAAAAALARLNVFQALAQAGDDATLTPAEIAARALPGKAVSVSYLARLLRLMAANKVLREVVTVGDDGGVTERRYAFTPMGRFLVDDPSTGSVMPTLLVNLTPGAAIPVWEHIHESVLDDSVEPFVRAYGVSVFEYKQRHPEFDTLFNRAMAGMSQLYIRAALDEYHGFEGVKVLVDVGGGFGAAVAAITARYPHIKGINFDEPHVIDACPHIPGVEHVSGNMFESVPSGGDAIFMRYILHNWDDESCVKILKNCFQALPPHGKVIAMEHVLPETIDCEGGDRMAILMDIIMLMFFQFGAKERTEGEFRKLGLAAGFQKVEVVCKIDDVYGMTEFHKAA